MKAARVGWLAALCGLLTCGYVGRQAVQEDNHMRPWSPLAWLLVDGRLWHLEPAPACVIAGYDSTVGDGPKLPGSDVTLHCAMSRADAEAWARQWLTHHGFRAQARASWAPPESAAPTAMETDTELADYVLADLSDGGVALRIALHDRPR